MRDGFAGMFGNWNGGVKVVLVIDGGFILLENTMVDCLMPYNFRLRGGKCIEGEGLERKCRLKVWEECRKTKRKVKVWRVDGGWKYEVGMG